MPKRLETDESLVLLEILMSLLWSPYTIVLTDLMENSGRVLPVKVHHHSFSFVLEILDSVSNIVVKFPLKEVLKNFF